MIGLEIFGARRYIGVVESIGLPRLFHPKLKRWVLRRQAKGRFVEARNFAAPGFAASAECDQPPCPRASWERRFLQFPFTFLFS